MQQFTRSRIGRDIDVATLLSRLPGEQLKFLHVGCVARVPLEVVASEFHLRHISIRPG